MSKPLKKGTKIFLAILIVAVLLCACFVSVAIYARNEFKKERSWIPLQLSPQKSSVTELPDNAHDAYEYVMRLYDEALRSDIVEAGWYTDVDLNGDMQLPFAEVDNGLVNDIRGEAVGAVKALYPDESGVTLSDERHADIPAVNLQENEILEYAYNADDIFTRKGEYRSDTYEIVFKVDPAFEDVEELLHFTAVTTSRRMSPLQTPTPRCWRRPAAKKRPSGCLIRPPSISTSCGTGFTSTRIIWSSVPTI